jgi:hypothetical protein
MKTENQLVTNFRTTQNRHQDDTREHKKGVDYGC